MRRRLAAGVAVLAAVLVSVLATLPEERRAGLHSRGELHPFFHLAVFAAIGLLSAWSTRSAERRVLLCCGVVLLGCATELTEHVMYGNAVEWTDMLLDAMGAVAGTSLGALLAPRLLQRNRVAPY